MSPAEERVALYDDAGEPCGVERRGTVRTTNLRHAATAVVVRDPWGRIYVHRRTDTKDVYPGLLDFAAGGMVRAGEDPGEAAVRELAEELGVHDVPLQSVTVGDYADPHTRYRGFCYVTEWNGEVVWQPEEVADGQWMLPERVADRLQARPQDFVPDTPGLLGGWLHDRVADRIDLGQGWDSHTTLVEGRWVDRVPRTAALLPQLQRETRLLPVLAARLPLPVPRPTLVDDDPPRFRHRLVPGAADGHALTAADGEAVGRFLRELHATPATVYAELVPTAAESRTALLGDLARMADEVLTLLPAPLRGPGRELLETCDRAHAAGPSTLVHGDLGPEHVLREHDQVSGIIDWGDARVHDPAIDLAWTLHGAPTGFAEALAAAYGVTAELWARGLAWHRLGPWHEVLWGLGDGGAAYVESGLAGVRKRLSAT